MKEHSEILQNKVQTKLERALRNITKRKPLKFERKDTKKYYRTKPQQNLKGHSEILQNKDPTKQERALRNNTRQRHNKTWNGTKKYNKTKTQQSLKGH